MTGINEKVELMLRALSMSNGYGYVSPNSKTLIRLLRSKGYKVDTDLEKGGFDWIYLSKKYNTPDNLLNALTKLNFYGIILWNGVDGIHTWRLK